MTNITESFQIIFSRLNNFEDLGLRDSRNIGIEQPHTVL